MVFRDIDKKSLIENSARVLSKITIVGTDITFTEDDFISEWDYEDYRYVPENGFIGQFVERLLDGKFKDLSTDVNIEDKEINLQVGIVNGIDNQTTWYDYGNFIITKPGEKDVSGITSFESADYAKKFNQVYVDNIEYPCLALELANNVCEQVGVELAGIDLPSRCYIVGKDGLPKGDYSFSTDNTRYYYQFSTTRDLKYMDTLMLMEGFSASNTTVIEKHINDDYTITRNVLQTRFTSDKATLLEGRDVKYSEFINNDFVIENNQFEEGTTCRDVMKAIGKLAYTWVRIGTDNKVHLDFSNKMRNNDPFGDSDSPIDFDKLISEYKAGSIVYKDNNLYLYYGETSSSAGLLTSRVQYDLTEDFKKHAGDTFEITFDSAWYNYPSDDDEVLDFVSLTLNNEWIAFDKIGKKTGITSVKIPETIVGDVTFEIGYMIEPRSHEPSDLDAVIYNLKTSYKSSAREYNTITTDDYYESEKQPNTFGPVTSVKLGVSNIEGEYVESSFPVDKLTSMEVEGKSYQETRSDKNKFMLTKGGSGYGITVTYNNDGTFNFTGTASDNASANGSTVLQAFFPFEDMNVENGKSYTLSSNKILPDGLSVRFEVYNHNADNTYSWIRAVVGGINSKEQILTGVLNTTGGNRIRLSFQVFKDAVIDIENIGFQIEEGTVATDWQPYGVIPSTKNPSEIKSVKGITNLFDYSKWEKNVPALNASNSSIEVKDNSITISSTTTTDTFTSSGMSTTGGVVAENQRKYLIPVKPNRKYALIFDVSSSGNFYQNSINSSYYSLYTKDFKSTRYGNLTNMLIPSRHIFRFTTDSDTEYVGLRLGVQNANNTITYKNIMLVEDNLLYTYVPYGTWLPQITTGKNVCNIQEKPFYNGTGLTVVNSGPGVYLMSGTGKESELRFLATWDTKTVHWKLPKGNYKMYAWLDDVAIKTEVTIADNNTNKYGGSSFSLNDLQGIATFRLLVPIVEGKVYNNSVIKIMIVEESNDDGNYEEYKENIALIDMNKPNLFDKSLLNNFTGNLQLITLTLKPNTVYTMATNLPIHSENGYNLFFHRYGVAASSWVNGVKEGRPRTAVSDSSGRVVIEYRDLDNLLTDEINKYDYYLYEGINPYYEFSEIKEGNNIKAKDSFKNGIVAEQVYKIVLTGNEDYSVITNTAGLHRAMYYLPKMGKASSFGICSHFTSKPREDSEWNYYDNCYIGNAGNDLIMYSEKADTLEHWKEYVKQQFDNGTPITFCYRLDTPQTYTLPYTPLTLFEGYNRITVDDELDPNLKLTVTDLFDKNTEYSGNPVELISKGYKKCSIDLYDNPITYTETLRRIALNGSQALFGLYYTPLDIETVGHPWLEGDDMVKVNNLNDEELYTYPFNRKLSYKGYIKSNISSSAKTSIDTEYDFKGDTDNRIRKTEISVDKANQRITALASDVGEHDSKIASLTITTEEIKSEVSEKVTASQVNNSIDNKLKNYSTTTQMNSAITQSASSITSEVNKTIDNINIGGTNLLRGTATASGDVGYGSGTMTVVDTDLYGGLKGVKTHTSWTGRYMNLKAVASRGGFEVGDNLVASVYIKADRDVVATVTFHRSYGTGNIMGSKKSYQNVTLTPKWQQFWFPFTADDGSLNRTDTRVEINVGTGDNYIYWAGWKLEKGTKATDWSPSPDDYSTTTQMNNIIQQKIDDETNEIKLEVDKKVNNSDFTKAQIVAKINDNTSTVKIAANNINLNGAVTANNYFKINTDGSMEATNGKFTGNILIKDAGETGGYSNLKIESNNGTSTFYSNGFNIKSGQNTLALNTNRISLSGSNALYPNKSNLRFYAEPGNMIISDGSVSNIDNIIFSCNPDQINIRNPLIRTPPTLPDHAIRLQDLDYKLTAIERFQVFNASSPYLEVQIKASSPNWSSYVYGISMWPSDKRLKQDIEDSQVNALDIVKNIKHREFRYKNSPDTLIKIGYVADELQELDEQMIFEVGEDKIKQPKESYITPILSKAIQEQQEIIEKQQKQIDDLEKRLSDLENKQ